MDPAPIWSLSHDHGNVRLEIYRRGHGAYYYRVATWREGTTEYDSQGWHLLGPEHGDYPTGPAALEAARSTLPWIDEELADLSPVYLQQLVRA